MNSVMLCNSVAGFLVAIFTCFLDILIIVKQIDNMRSIRLFNGMVNPILDCFMQGCQSMCPFFLVFLGNTQYTVPIGRPT